MKPTNSRSGTPLKLLLVLITAAALLTAGYLMGRYRPGSDQADAGTPQPEITVSLPDSTPAAETAIPEGNSPMPEPEFEAEQVRPGLNAVVSGGTGDTSSHEVPETPEPAPEKGIAIPGYTIIPVEANSTTLSIDLFNPDANEVYFQIGFFLTETGEKLFETKLIRPGQHLYTLEMSRGLEPGDHPVTIQYSTFSTDGSFTPRNGATMGSILRAE